MAAPLGFKDFQAGAVLTAADVDGYLMAQSVMTFANATARTAAVTSPQEGNLSFLKDTNSFEIYDGAAWVAYGAGDITGVTAGTGISGGGTSGTVTITNSMATAIDAKGDLIAGTGDDAFSRLAVGSNGQVLTADSTAATGLKWATAGAGFVGCQAYNNTTQSINTNSSTEVTFNSENFDTDNFHSTSSNTGRMTIPSGKAGKYLVIGYINFNLNATGYRQAEILKNGSQLISGYYVNRSVGTSAETQVNPVAVVDCSVGDYITMNAFQDSGGSLTIGTYGSTRSSLTVIYLGA